MLKVQLYEVIPFILQLDFLKQGVMPWVAYIAMNVLIFYGIFITPILSVHVNVKKMF